MATQNFNSPLRDWCEAANPSYVKFDDLLQWAMRESDGKVLYAVIITRVVLSSVNDFDEANDMLASIGKFEQLGGLHRMCKLAIDTRVDLHHLCLS
jgi:hypothetical protein